MIIYLKTVFELNTLNSIELHGYKNVETILYKGTNPNSNFTTIIHTESNYFY